MAFDSLQFACAVVLFATCVGGWWMAAPHPARVRLYLRFGAVLLAAIAMSVPLRMSDAMALFLLPLVGASLAIAALARFTSALPVWAVTLALVASLFAGLGAMLWDLPMLALTPVIISALAIIAAALNRLAILASLSGAALLGAGLAMFEQGSGFLLFAAAVLVGLVKPGARPAKKSALAVQQ